MTREERELAIEELQGCIIAEEHGKDGKPNGNVTCELTKDTIDMAIKALEQEPTTKNYLGVDCISRKTVIDELKRYFHDEYYQRTSIQDCSDCFIEDVLIHLPSVTPQEPKTGHWISTETKGVRYAFWCRYKCSLCGGLSARTNFCPNCGARMVEPQESEDRE